jgi:ubiquinone/menaquinone biosynthesis C-methylase UbiE
MSKKLRKKKPINVETYNQLIKENEILQNCVEITKNKFKLPVGSLLEIGTGTGKFLTKYLIENERAKKIGKFYGMEPVDELFEESKKHVVRLSRTDATAQEYFGGNPFDVITFSLVLSHITDDKKRSFIKHVYSNLEDEGKLILFETLLQPFTTHDEKIERIKQFQEEHIQYFKRKKNKIIKEFIEAVINDDEDDYIFGDYKTSLENLTKILEDVGFTNVKIELYKDKQREGVDWKKLGYYIISADKE